MHQISFKISVWVLLSTCFKILIYGFPYATEFMCVCACIYKELVSAKCCLKDIHWEARDA